MNELPPPTPDSGNSPAAADNSGEFELESGDTTGVHEIPPLHGFLIDEDEDDRKPRYTGLQPPPLPGGPDNSKVSSSGKRGVARSLRRTPGLVDKLVVLVPALTGAVVTSVGAVAITGGQEHESKPLPQWVWPVTLAAITMLLASGLWALWLYRKAKFQQAEREREVLESAADRLRERMELPSLVNFNRVLLDRYHGIATDQATKAYRSSRFAMAVGLIILVAAFFAGWRFNSQGDRLFVGSVAGVGSAFAAYLSRTYMKTYERALQQLNKYFNQPVLNGYFLTAERIADSLPEDRRVAMLEQVVADVLESGKEMHRSATAANVTQDGASGPGLRRRSAQPEAQVPAQQGQ